ncbi:hypothetical protein JCM18382A_41240 [Bradyrhizobium sp. 17-4]
MDGMETARAGAATVKASSVEATRTKPAAVETATTAMEATTATEAAATVETAATVTAAAGCLCGIGEQRHRCRGREHRDERQPDVSAASHVRSHLCQNTQ